MTPVQTIFHQARRQLYVLAAATVIVLVVVVGSNDLRNHIQEGVEREGSELSAQKALMTQKELDLNNIQTHIDQFRSLKKQGLVGAADREGWAEQLVASRQALGLGGVRLSYTLAPPQALGDGVAAENAAADPSAPLRHDMVIELMGIHEVELLNLLQDYKSHVNGQFRVESCHLSNPEPAGLGATCTLRFFTLPDVTKPS